MKKILVLFTLSILLATSSTTPFLPFFTQAFSLPFLPSGKNRKKVYAGATVALIAGLAWYNRAALKDLAASGCGIPTLLKK